MIIKSKSTFYFEWFNKQTNLLCAYLATLTIYLLDSLTWAPYKGYIKTVPIANTMTTPQLSLPVKIMVNCV